MVLHVFVSFQNLSILWVSHSFGLSVCLIFLWFYWFVHAKGTEKKEAIFNYSVTARKSQLSLHVLFFQSRIKTVFLLPLESVAQKIKCFLFVCCFYDHGALHISGILRKGARHKRWWMRAFFFLPWNELIEIYYISKNSFPLNFLKFIKEPRTLPLIFFEEALLIVADLRLFCLSLSCWGWFCFPLSAHLIQCCKMFHRNARALASWICSVILEIFCFTDTVLNAFKLDYCFPRKRL